MVSLIAVSLAGCLLATGTAQVQAESASTVRLVGSTLTFVAAAQTANKVVVREVETSVSNRATLSGYYLITDNSGTAITAYSPCVATGPATARCPGQLVTSLRLDLGDRSDSGTNQTCAGAYVTSRGEDDQYTGGCGADVVHGGAGEDKLIGGHGDDQMFGDEGDDFLDGQGGTDTGDGGPDSSGGAGPDQDACTLATETRAACRTV